MSRAPPSISISPPVPVRVVVGPAAPSSSSQSSVTTTALTLLAVAAVAGAAAFAYRSYSTSATRSSSLPSRPSRLAMSSKASALSAPSYTKKPVVVTITGAAGQIGYSIIFMVAAGRMLGEDQPIELRLLDMSATPHPGHPLPVKSCVTPRSSPRMCVLMCSAPMMGVVQGVMMELDDCAFPLLTSQWSHSITPLQLLITSAHPLLAVR